MIGPGSKVKVNTTNCRYQVVKECLYEAGLKEVEYEDSWDLLWMDCGISLERALSLKVGFLNATYISLFTTSTLALSND